MVYDISIISLLSDFIFSKIAMTKTQSQIHLFPYFQFSYSKNTTKTSTYSTSTKTTKHYDSKLRVQTADNVTTSEYIQL